MPTPCQDELAAAAQVRLELVARDNALRECLLETEIPRVNVPTLQLAVDEGRSKGASALVLQNAEELLDRCIEYWRMVEHKNKGIPTWIVDCWPMEHVHVRTEKFAGAPILGQKNNGEVLRGFLGEDGWLELPLEEGIAGFIMVYDVGNRSHLKPFNAATAQECGLAFPETWFRKFFKCDRLVREAFTLLLPEFQNTDLVTSETDEMADLILQIGRRLYDLGSFEGNPLWEKEESPEFVLSLEAWESATQARCCEEFDRFIQKASDLADEGYAQMGHLSPRLAMLRWACCMAWIGHRSQALAEVSTGRSYGIVSRKVSAAANLAAKQKIFEYLRKLTKEYGILSMLDYDLIGHGVWHDGCREPVPKLAQNEWYRRGVEYDIIRLCQQVLKLPPDSLNPSAATFIMVQPYLTPDWILPPPESTKHILKKHGWMFELVSPGIDNLHTKVWINGHVMHIERPPDYEHDFSDPAVHAKVERGDPLGKGDQEDGLPGSIHGSIALLYAALFAENNIEHVHVYPGLLNIDYFLEYLLKCSPPLLTLSFHGCGEDFPVEVLDTIHLAGDSLLHLDLSECCLEDTCVDTIVDVLKYFPNLRHIDLANNKLDRDASTRLIEYLTSDRIDVPSIRLDGNPIGNVKEFQESVATALAVRGSPTLAGGELTLHLDEDMVRWCPQARQGTFAHRNRNDDHIKAIAIKDVRALANLVNKKLNKYENEDPAAKTSGGRDWLRRRRELNNKIYDSTLIKMYKAEIKHRVEMKDAEEQANKEKDEQAQAAKEAEEAARLAEGKAVAANSDSD